MKTISALTFCLLASADAFSSNSAFTGFQMTTSAQNKAGITMEYIPSGMSKEQWQRMKEAEKNKNRGKNLGANGITTFKSRSFMDWQRSGGKNLFPVDPKRVKDPKELPYMQRPGGAADDSDIKKKPAVSLFGKKKEAPAPAPAPEQKKNWWTL